MDDATKDMTTQERRQFLRRGSGLVLSASAVALLAGCESMASSHGGKSAADDAAILNFALGLEHEAIGAYEVAAGSGVLSQPVLQAAALFLGHHRQHRDTLASVISQMGARPVASKGHPAYIAKLKLDQLSTERQILNLAQEMERQAANAYLGAVPKFLDGGLAHAAARISADEVLHYTVLTQVLGGALPPEALSFGA